MFILILLETDMIKHHKIIITIVVLLVLSILMVVLLYFIHCSGQYCPNGRVEDGIMAFQQMGQNYMIIVYAVLLTISI